ncbi:complement C1r subcomponent-like protein [Heptranchias perlo]|uniref:complement C1r subcomponent-like protein n=1 Tax=Heptranchias perlo TaxID=212740 RepID=UPI003559DC32
MTAAHVLYPKGTSRPAQADLNKCQVYLGDNNLEDLMGTQAFPVEQVYLHEGFSGSRHYHHDLALVKLSQPVKLTASIMPVCLPSARSQSLYRPYCWATTVEESHLRYVGLPMADQAKCAQAMRRAQDPAEALELTPAMFCAGTGLGETDSCQGDSGGAFSVHDRDSDTWYATGIVSWGLGCGVNGTYGVYTRVSSHRHWIDETLSGEIRIPDSPKGLLTPVPSCVFCASIGNSPNEARIFSRDRNSEIMRLLVLTVIVLRACGTSPNVPPPSVSSTPPGHWPTEQNATEQDGLAENGTRNATIGLKACGRPSNPATGTQRILGGRLAEEGSFPWHVLVLPKGRGRAAGTLIGDRWVLTAAHALYPKGATRQGPDLLCQTTQIRTGGGTRLMSGYDREIEEIVVHPKFGEEPHDFDNDIALIRLRGSAGEPMPACLPAATRDDGGLFAPGRVGYVAGWGMEEGYYLRRRLRYALLPLVEQPRCRQAFRTARIGGRAPVVSANMFCAGLPEGGRDACAGDTGGGLLVPDPSSGAWHLVGIVSWGVGCGRPGSYGVYTRVSRYLAWIDRVISARP